MHSTSIIKISFLTSHFPFLFSLSSFHSIRIKLKGDIVWGGEKILLKLKSEVDVEAESMGKIAPMEVDGDRAEGGVVAVLECETPVVLVDAFFVGEIEEGGKSFGGVEVVGDKGEVLFVGDFETIVGA